MTDSKHQFPYVMYIMKRRKKNFQGGGDLFSKIPGKFYSRATDTFQFSIKLP